MTNIEISLNNVLRLVFLHIIEKNHESFSIVFLAFKNRVLSKQKGVELDRFFFCQQAQANKEKTF